MKEPNAFAVRATNTKTQEKKILKTFYDNRHDAAEDYAGQMRKGFENQPLKFSVATGFYKCWSCGDHSTDDRFLVVDEEGDRVCRRCDNAPEMPRDVWAGKRCL